MPIRFLVRQGRWFARGAGVLMAGLVFEALHRNELIQLPGMTEPYEVGLADPYWMPVVAYVATTWLLKRAINLCIREAGSHVQRISRGGWFKP